MISTLKLSIGLAAVSLVTLAANAQTACGASYVKGQKFHYTREDAPSITDIDGIGLLTPKELKEKQKQFDIEVNTGQRKGKEYKFDMVISDVKSGKNGNIYEFEFAAATAKYHSYNVCSNDTLYGIRSLTGSPMMSGSDTVGFFKLGVVQYPLKMQVGDVLPVTTDLSYTFPKSFDLSSKRMVLDHVLHYSSSHESQGYVYTYNSWAKFFREMTVHLSYDIQFSSPTNTYRHVVAEEEVEVGGKKYKAFKIELVLQTKVDDVITNINADERMVKWALDFTNNYVKNKSNKSKDLRNTGFEWFVPELGAIVKSEILDSNGKMVNKLILNGVE